MNKHMSKFVQATLRWLALTILLSFGALAGTLLAQSTPGEPGYQFPSLAEKDFQLFLQLIEQIESSESANALYSRLGVTETYAEAVVMKITMNAMIEMGAMDAKDEMIQQCSSSLKLNDEEKALFKKFESRIMDA
jgi:hypothetical protein